MAILLSIFANDILPIFVVALAGYLLVRFAGADVRTMSRVTFYALSPALVFNLLTTTQIGTQELAQMVLFTVVTMLLVGAIAAAVALAWRMPREKVSALSISVMFANAGNYGLPLVLFAFGQAALERATIFFVVNVIMTYTLGIFLICAGRQSALKALASVFKVPVIYAVIAAVFVLAVGVEVPPVLARPIDLLSGAAIPAMILVLGMQFANSTAIAELRMVGVASVLRLVVSPLLAFLIAGIVGLQGPALQAGVTQAGMPAAVILTILALEYNLYPAFATSAVFVSTLLSPLTLTLLVALLQGGI